MREKEQAGWLKEVLSAIDEEDDERLAWAIQGGRDSLEEIVDEVPLGKIHPSHKMRGCWDSSYFDEVCELCNQGDPCIGSNPKLSQPCRGE